MDKLKRIGKNRNGMSYPLTVSLVLALLILLCVMAEFFRLQIIAFGVRDAMQQSVISVATTNYNEVYDGIREGYSGGYVWNGSGWEQSLDYGDVYNHMDRILGTQIAGNYHIKPQAGSYEYRLSDLNVEIENTELAPGTAARNFQAACSMTLEIPLSFGWQELPTIKMTIRTKAAYMPKF